MKQKLFSETMGRMALDVLLVVLCECTSLWGLFSLWPGLSRLVSSRRAHVKPTKKLSLSERSQAGENGCLLVEREMAWDWQSYQIQAFCCQILKKQGSIKRLCLFREYVFASHFPFRLIIFESKGGIACVLLSEWVFSLEIVLYVCFWL